MPLTAYTGTLSIAMLVRHNRSTTWKHYGCSCLIRLACGFKKGRFGTPKHNRRVLYSLCCRDGVVWQMLSLGVLVGKGVSRFP